MIKPLPDPSFNIDDDLADAIARGWLTLLADNGLEVAAREAKIVNDAIRAAGSLDRVCLATRTLTFGDSHLRVEANTHVVVDIKTSRLHADDDDGTPSYWAKYPIQVETYRDSVQYDPDTDERTPWPFEIDDKVALIAHLDIDRAIDERVVVWQLIAVDLDVARQGIAAVQAAEAYHAATKFAMPDTVTTLKVPEVAPWRKTAKAAARIGRTPDEGHMLPDRLIDTLRNQLKKLPVEARTWVGARVAETTAAGASVSMADTPTQRRYAVCKGLVAFADAFIYEACPDSEVDEVGRWVRAACAEIVGAEVAHSMSHTIGAVLASLDADEAERFAVIADECATLRRTVSYDAAGRPVLAASAA